MKKIAAGLVLLIACGSVAKAQDYKKVRSAFVIAQMPNASDQKLEDAKAELDKVLADPKAEGKAETYLLKAEILGTISGNANLKAKYPNADVEAFEALKKYLELEPSGEKFKQDNYAGVNAISQSFFGAAAKYYDAQSWDSAYAKFQNVGAFSDLLISKKWTNVTFDTSTYLYTGVAAQNAKKDADAAKYYSKLADLKVKGKQYEHIYAFLPTFYSEQKDEANFRKYLQLGKEVYPEKTFWGDMEFEYLTNNLSLPELVKKFEEDSAANKLDATQYANYGNFFSNDKKIKDLSESQKMMYNQKALSAFTRASQLDSANALSTFNVGVTAYNIWLYTADSARTIRGVTPAIKAKRAAADKVADAYADNTIEWLEKAYNQLAASPEKDRLITNSQKTTARLLSALFEYKRERSKVIKPADFDKFDAKFKFYDTKY